VILINIIIIIVINIIIDVVENYGYVAQPFGPWRVYLRGNRWVEWARARSLARRGRKYWAGLQEPKVDSCDRPKGLQGIVHAYLLDGRRHPVWQIVDGCYQAWRTSSTLQPLWPNQVARIEQTSTS